MKKWFIKSDNGLTKENFKNNNEFSYITCQLLANRKIDYKNVKKFLYPDYKYLHNPFLMKDLDIAIEIIVDAIKGGHKILLFSGYSSMFEYIENELNKHGIRFMKLVGQTKVDTRMDLVNKFNEDDDIKVFLISLKAGGTGLNLISADMVIHYDPWWNLSAENQATDRTYRIGQKRNVQVYKLITKNSIEEKIYNLQEKKAKLANDMLSTNEVFLNKLSKDEIMNLFE